MKDTLLYGCVVLLPYCSTRSIFTAANKELLSCHISITNGAIAT